MINNWNILEKDQKDFEYFSIYTDIIPLNNFGFGLRVCRHCKKPTYSIISAQDIPLCSECYDIGCSELIKEKKVKYICKLLDYYLVKTLVIYIGKYL